MTIEHEIAKLQEQIDAKKAELNSQPEAIPHDKEILHEVVGEQIQQHAAQQQVSAPAVVPVPVTPPPTVADQEGTNPEVQVQVQQLVNVAFTKNINEAIQEAVKTGNAAVIDAFHDVLVDELYGELIERKKVEQL
jgi:hypothetical protein